jgi:hypothetical protein
MLIAYRRLMRGFEQHTVGAAPEWTSLSIKVVGHVMFTVHLNLSCEQLRVYFNYSRTNLAICFQVLAYCLLRVLGTIRI